jgi:CheY-like chemotaxis protein
MVTRVLVIDDIRTAAEAEGWEFTHARTIEEAVTELHTKKYDEVWFDHDMGYDETGQFVTTIPIVTLLANDAEFRDYRPLIVIHTLNPVGREQIKSILKGRGFTVDEVFPGTYGMYFSKEF